MTSLVGAGSRIDFDRLLGRVQALDNFLQAADGHLPEQHLVPARAVVEHAGQRLALSRDHTVVALTGSTGSGKSSLFNALSKMDLSPVGARRPTTSAAYACAWCPAQDAADLLDWLAVLPRHRFTRESALDGDTELALRGLVLLDLPDFDSIEASHRTEVDRLLELVDLVVWVVDPQKYADKLIHDGYLRRFPRHRDVTVVALNHADRLAGDDLQRCLADLRKLLDADGLAGVATLASSAYGAPGHDELRARLEQAVAARQTALHRLAADIDRVTAGLSTVVNSGVADPAIDPVTAGRLAASLAAAAGTPGLVRTIERRYRHRAVRYFDWPPLRLLRRLRLDPLRRLARQSGPGSADWTALTPSGEPTRSQGAAVELAARALAERTGEMLPTQWRPAVSAAARSRLKDLPGALDRAAATVFQGRSRPPLWWWLVAGGQWLAAAATVAGLVGLLVGYVWSTPGPPPPDYLSVGPLSPATLLLAGGVLFGLGVAALGRPLATVAARRARVRAESRLRAALIEVAREYVVAPVDAVLAAYRRARHALAVARGDR